MSPQLRARERECGERKPSAGISSTYCLSTGPRNTHDAANFYTQQSTSPLALLFQRSLRTQGHYPPVPAKRLWLWGVRTCLGSRTECGGPAQTWACHPAPPAFMTAPWSTLGEAGKNDPVWATGPTPDVRLHQCQPSDGRGQRRDTGTEEELPGMRGLR